MRRAGSSMAYTVAVRAAGRIRVTHEVGRMASGRRAGGVTPAGVRVARAPADRGSTAEAYRRSMRAAGMTRESWGELGARPRNRVGDPDRSPGPGPGPRWLARVQGRQGHGPGPGAGAVRAPLDRVGVARRHRDARHAAHRRLHRGGAPG